MRRPANLQAMTHLRFDGHIAGVGTTSGLRAVVGRCASSPMGAFADVMVETAEGHRVLLAPSQEVADFVATTYHFDEVRIEPVAVTDVPGAGAKAPSRAGTWVRWLRWTRPAASASAQRRARRP